MNQGTIAVIALSVLLVVWYLVGHLYNRRRGHRLRRWLEAGLAVLDGETEAGWIGSPASGARINVRRAKEPFRRLEITILLENREIPLLWLLDRLRGRRDGIIIRATLRSPRRGEVEVAADRLTNQGERSLSWRGGPHGLSVGHQGVHGQRMVATLEPWLHTYGSQLRYFHWRTQDPHINLQLRLAGLLETKAETFLTDLSTALRTS